MLVLTLPDEQGLAKGKHSAGDLDRTWPVVASVFLMLVQSRENGFPASLSVMMPNLTKYKEFYSGQLLDREDP